MNHQEFSTELRRSKTRTMLALVSMSKRCWIGWKINKFPINGILKVGMYEDEEQQS